MIQRAHIKDLPVVAGLFNLYRIFYRKTDDPQGALKFLQERMENKESVIFLHKEEGIITGFTQLYPLFSSTRMCRTWLLNDLFVLPEYRGRGISKQLLDAAKEWARDTGSAGLLLETEKSNTIGNRLYPSAGFTLYDETNFYWWENK